jgi:hypothetical protein
VLAFFCYQESLEFSGFDEQAILRSYPRIVPNPPQGFNAVDEHGKRVRGPWEDYPPLSLYRAVELLNDEREGKLDARRRDILAELRARSEFPYSWEVETKKVNKSRFPLVSPLASRPKRSLGGGRLRMPTW